MENKNGDYIYRYKNYTAKDLQDLFQSVGWLSANYQERLKKALDNKVSGRTCYRKLRKNTRIICILFGLRKMKHCLIGLQWRKVESSI